jgi:spore germination cell wall hydrolase CwlJ-like protein
MGIRDVMALAMCALAAGSVATVHAAQADILAPASAVVLPASAPIPTFKPIAARDASGTVESEPSTKYSELECLARGIYFEARGEPANGRLAVALVILNRVKSKAYPASICEVVYQNAHMPNRCQFSFACDGEPDTIKERGKWREIVAHADRLLQNQAIAAASNQLWASTHYHAAYVSPHWASKLISTGRVGKHLFYRQGAA